MRSGYAETLIRRVIENSDANNWDAAVEEWDVVDCEEDEELAESCVCGKERLRYLFTIKNQFNGNLLFPIGSSCIRKFGRADLQEAVRIQEGMYKLLHAVEDDDYIELTSEFFSRKLLRALYDQGAFIPTQYNGGDGWVDYEFMLDMFNKRDKSSISPRQQRKVRAIIVTSIRPFLKSRLRTRKR